MADFYKNSYSELLRKHTELQKQLEVAVEGMECAMSNIGVPNADYPANIKCAYAYLDDSLAKIEGDG